MASRKVQGDRKTQKNRQTQGNRVSGYRSADGPADERPADGPGAPKTCSLPGADAPSDAPSLVSGWHAEFGAALGRFLGQGVRAPEDAQDLAQEVFLRLLRVDRPDLIRSPQAYLYRVAVHVLDEWRTRQKRIRSVPYDETDDIAASEDISTVEQRQQIMTDIGRALHNLPPRQAATLILHWHYGMTYREIADRLQVTERMVKRYIVKGYAEMRLQLKNKE